MYYAAGNLLKSSNATTKPSSDAELQCVPEISSHKVVWFKKGGGLIEAKENKFIIDDGNFTLTIMKVGELTCSLICFSLCILYIEGSKITSVPLSEKICFLFLLYAFHSLLIPFSLFYAITRSVMFN